MSDDLAWHYTDGPGLLAILRGHALWATSAWFLNDQQEVALGGRLVVERLRELARDDPSGAFDALVEHLRPETDAGEGPRPDSFYVLSASRSPDSLAMWRLYGGVQESYAIGLDPHAALSVLADDGDVGGQTGGSPGFYLRRQSWQPVRYDRADQRRLVDELLLDLPSRAAAIRDALDELDPAHPVVDRTMGGLLDDVQEALMLIKHEGFADERETRYSVIAFARPDVPEALAREARLVRFRATPYGIAPYVRLTGSPEDGAAVTTTPAPLPVRAVTVSPSPNGAAAETSLRRLLAASGYGDAEVRRSAIPFRG